MTDEKQKFNKVAYNNAFNAQAYDRINIAVKKGERTRYQEHAKNRNKSLTNLIVDLIEKDIADYEKEKKERDNTENK